MIKAGAGECLFRALSDACERGSLLLPTVTAGEGKTLLDGYFDLDKVAELFVAQIQHNFHTTGESSMSTEPSRTAVSTAVAGEVSNAVTFQQLERMAASVAKSGLFAVKTPEAALTLMLVAQSEGTHPVTAMMEYDIIEGKPSLKSSAMLTRFLRAGGKVEWHAQSNDSVSGTFTSPRGNAITVTWDAERVKRAGLEGRPNHQKFPMQMKRARCIAEGIRAVWPVTQLYTPEELSDVPDSIDITPTATASRVDDAVTATAGPNALSEEDRDAHFNSIGGAPDVEKLKGAFSAAWKHASEAKDHAAGAAFKQVYESRKTELGAVI